MLLKFVFSVAAALAVSTAPAFAACPIVLDSPPREISIPAQPLEKALLALAAQTDVDVLFEPSTVAGLTSIALRGHMSAGDALCRLLSGFDLDYRINADRSVIIT